MHLDSLHKLFVHELKDLYSAENQLLDALPEMAAACKNDKLKQAFKSHLDETKTHVKRLEQIFKKLDFEPGGHKCVAMEGLIKEGKELMKSEIGDDVLDAGLIAAAQRVEHYEIAGYGTARTYAEKMGDFETADLLQETLNEEGLADQTLSRLATRSINFEAMVGH